MRVLGPDEIRRRIGAARAIAAMRDAVLAQAEDLFIAEACAAAG